MPWKSFADRNCDYWIEEGQGFMSPSEDFIWGKSEWYYLDGLGIYLA